MNDAKSVLEARVIAVGAKEKSLISVEESCRQKERSFDEIGKKLLDKETSIENRINMLSQNNINEIRNTQ